MSREAKLRFDPLRQRTHIHAMMKMLPVTVAAGLACLFLSSAPALAGDGWQETDGARVRLLIEPPAAGTTVIRGLIDIDLEPGWKTYWRDPGSSGIPPVIDVSQAAGFIGADIHFPAPMWIETDYGAYAGYDRPVGLPVTFTRSATSLPAELSASVFLGVCDEVCVPVQMTFTTMIEAANGTSVEGARVARAHAALPGAPDAAFSIEALPGASPGKARFAVTVRDPDAPAEVFIFSADGTQFHRPALTEADSHSRVFETSPIRMKPGGFAGSVHVTVVSGSRAIETVLDLEILPPG